MSLTDWQLAWMGIGAMSVIVDNMPDRDIREQGLKEHARKCLEDITKCLPIDAPVI